MSQRINPWRLPLLIGAVGWRQPIAYALLFRRGGFEFGWFKTDAGRIAGLLLLDFPFYGVLMAVGAACIFGTSQLWRDRRRLEILGLWTWDALVFLIFAVPSVFINLHGNGWLHL